MIIQTKHKWTKHLGDRLLATRWPWLLRWFYYVRPPLVPSVPAALLRFAQANNKDTFFVQVGAHVGGVRDPLFRHILLDHWQGLLIEPQPLVFQELQDFYQGTAGLQFANCAISSTKGEVAFHQLTAPQDLPEWASQLSSVEKRVTASALDILPGASVNTVQVPCTTLADLLATTETSQLDVLLIDTEGHDERVLSSLNWELYRPAMVIYEHFHLTEEDTAAARQLLEEYSYHLWQGRFNTVAVQDVSLIANWPNYAA